MLSCPTSAWRALPRIAKSPKVIPTQLEFVDIAGLVAGASRGEGLGNQFLGHIREVDAILHLLRCFDDPDVVHVDGSVDPLRDAEIIDTELMLADLESLERRLNGLVKRARGGDKEAKERPRCSRTGGGRAARGPAGAHSTARRGGEAGVRRSAAADREAGALCLQRRGGGCCHRQQRDGARRSPCCVEGAAAVIISARIEAEVAELSEDERGRVPGQASA